ncbi:hypothetical protein PR048_020475 [Dryococelus australis]|uniref:Uncharacterized protein n=1 Tax=Dryococelus australis TaxID=614101 RepID=A0ABQ9H6D1_9NEOP|nr:hypothetical protein PR048_020475 [Dryococelus australis]
MQVAVVNWELNGDPATAEKDAVAIAVPPSLLDPLAEQSAIMAGLEKYAEYNITVLCFTDPGDGRRSEPALVRTDEDCKSFIWSIVYCMHVEWLSFWEVTC